jgi:predicted nucleic acid-binding protein
VSVVVILDSDFLSAFLKIEQMPLIRSLYQVETVVVPPAVYREIALTNLLTYLTALTWIEIVAPSITSLETLATEESFRRLGAGEQQAIALAIEQKPTVLLGNDNQARRVAARLGVNVVNLPAFLLACKQAGLVDRQTLSRLIADLRAKDFFEFRQADLDLLMG